MNYKDLLNHKTISHIAHILVIGPLLIYLGIREKKAPKLAYYALGVLTLGIFAGLTLPQIKLGYWNIIKSLHYFIWVPLFLFIAYKNHSLDPNLFNLIIGIGAMAIVIHSIILGKYINLQMKLQKVEK